MNELYYWIYEHAPAWSSERWAYLALALSIIGVLYRFFSQRHPHPWRDKIAIALDFLESVVRNLRNRAKKRELDAEKTTPHEQDTKD